jgi:hypothetical protein
MYAEQYFIGSVFTTNEETVEESESIGPAFDSEDHRALERFVANLETTKSVSNIISRRWERNSVSELKPFLSQVCRLEKQDVFTFLPQSDMDVALGGSHLNNDKIEVAFFTSGLLTHEEEASRTNLFYPAIIVVPKNGKPKLRMRRPAINPLDPEVVFLGELFVSLFV